jgi:hypothetical protein
MSDTAADTQAPAPVVDAPAADPVAAPAEEATHEAPEAEAPPRPKRQRKPKPVIDSVHRYYNKDEVVMGDKVSVHFSDGTEAAKGTVVGMITEEDTGIPLVQILIGKGEEAFTTEHDGQTHYAGGTLTIAGLFLLPLSAEAAEELAKQEVKFANRVVQRGDDDDDERDENYTLYGDDNAVADSEDES